MAYMAAGAAVTAGLAGDCWNGGREKAEEVELGVAATRATEGSASVAILHSIIHTQKCTHT